MIEPSDSSCEALAKQEAAKAAQEILASWPPAPSTVEDIIQRAIDRARKEFAQAKAENEKLKAEIGLHEDATHVALSWSKAIAKRDAQLAEANAIIEKLHPRVLKLAARGKPFIVIGCHEPYLWTPIR